MRTSTSRDDGDGEGGAVGRAGPDVQPGSTPSSSIMARSHRRGLTAVIPKLQLDAEVLAFEEGNDGL